MKNIVALALCVAAGITQAQIFNRMQTVGDKVYYVYTAVVEVTLADGSPAALEKALTERDITLNAMKAHVSELATSRIVIDTEVNTREALSSQQQGELSKAESRYTSNTRLTSVVDVAIKIISEKKMQLHLQNEVEIWVLPVAIPPAQQTYADSLIGRYDLYKGKLVAERQPFKVVVKKEIIFDEGFRYTYFANAGRHFFTNDVNSNAAFLFGRVSQKDANDVSRLEYVSLLPGSYRAELQLKRTINEAWLRFDVEEIQFVLMIKLADTNIPVKDLLDIIKFNVPADYFAIEPLFSLKPRVVGNKKN